MDREGRVTTQVTTQIFKLRKGAPSMGLGGGGGAPPGVLSLAWGRVALAWIQAPPLEGAFQP
jgi:hypothetical protein